jgi:nucleoid-associated protein YgaU
LRLIADPRVLSVELLVVLAVAVALRHPITQAIGTAGGPVPVVRTEVPVLVATEPYYDFPLANDYSSPPELEAGADAAPAVVRRLTPASLPSAATYRVRSGDSLWRVAQRQLGRTADVTSIARMTRTIYAANKATIGSDPSRVTVGMSLTLR